ncbi:hypothetical protein [Pseudoduganella violaceinigra]|uniref:hypothetical protein n=1 Tax=Pseudoduganella violaceinigra TaxID=246602 RepID=UPI00054CF466|nr:hypothetical protein [Pseudoduganella violaceinigra]
MLKHLKRHWNEGRGDEYESWGTSWWFFEVNVDGEVLKQAELYEVGRLLRYSAAHLEDEFGALAEASIDMSDAEYTEISPEEFEAIWNRT